MNTIYTAITNGYDFYHPSTTLTAGWSDTVISVNALSPILRAREMKILFHEYTHTEVSVWHDGNIQVTGDLNTFIESLDWTFDFHIMRHPERDCIYKEAESVINLMKDDPETVRRQMQGYRLEAYPEHNGLVASGIMVRKNTEANRKFCEAWFNEVNNGSIRDQLSFNYVAHKMNLKYKLFDFIPGRWFRKHEHKNRS